MYLKDVCNLGLKSVAAARSVLGNYATLINPKYSELTSHVFVSRLIKGMGNLHPPHRPYQQIWNPQQVLDYFKREPPNEELSMFKLACKTATLAALVTGSRCQSIHRIMRHKMTINNNCYCCKIAPVLKTSKWGDKDHTLHLPRFEDPKICVFKAVKDYLERTKQYRVSEDDQLFIITCRPYRPATGSTISGWVRTCMSEAGIDTQIYKTHSTRKAATSQAAEGSVPLGTILHAAG